MGEVLTNGVYLPDRGERNAYDGLKGNWNTLDSIAGKVPGYDGHVSDTDIHVTAADKQTWNGKADASHVHNADDVTTGVFDAARIPNLDASKIATGTINIDRLPQGALERLVKVADQSARYALTASDVQLGDTVQQLDTGVMYVVTDVTKLDSADGYTEYTAGSATSVPWSGVTGKPADYTPASHSHGNITNDGKVGTTANKPLITGTGGVVQAGSFGNSANTFCEGNDSRLSDARTPVAHTHTKSDVTDLLNSNFIPSANNSYDLGSSSYQWNNLYAKNYYYNGVAWGLDKANTWTGNNTFSNVITSKGLTVTNNGRIYTEVPSLTKGTLPSGTYYYSIQNDYATDSSSANNRINQKRCYVTTDGTNVLEWNLTAWNTTNIAVMRLSITANGTDKTYLVDANTIPGTDSIYDLGTSTNKWKSLNGVNPGGLSLPGTGGYTDIKGDIANLSGGDNTFTAPYDGWVCIKSGNATAIHIINTTWAVSQSAAQSTAGTLCCLCPVMAGQSFNVIVNATSLDYAYIHPCRGNV